MSKRLSPSSAQLVVVAALAALMPSVVHGQAFDFVRLEEKVRSFSVIIDMDIEISFGSIRASRRIGISARLSMTAGW